MDAHTGYTEARPARLLIPPGSTAGDVLRATLHVVASGAARVEFAPLR